MYYIHRIYSRYIIHHVYIVYIIYRYRYIYIYLNNVLKLDYVNTLGRFVKGIPTVEV